MTAVGRREELERRMEEAAAALDFETAARLRDEIGRLPADDTGPHIRPQQPGAMGLGTSEPGRRRPEGWTPPPKPDPMTAGLQSRKHRRR